MLLLMLRTAKLRKGAGKFELEMRNACHLPPCSQLPFKGNSHALFSTSAPSAQQSRQKTTRHQSPGKTVRSGQTPCTRCQSLSLICCETLLSLPQLLGLSDQACGQQWLNHVQVQQRKALWRASEKAHESERQKRGGKQKWETSSLWQHLRTTSCFGYGWPHAFTPRRLTCAFLHLGCFPALSRNTSFYLNLLSLG